MHRPCVILSGANAESNSKRSAGAAAALAQTGSKSGLRSSVLRSHLAVPASVPYGFDYGHTPFAQDDTLAVHVGGICVFPENIISHFDVAVNDVSCEFAEKLQFVLENK